MKNWGYKSNVYHIQKYMHMCTKKCKNIHNFVIDVIVNHPSVFNKMDKEIMIWS